MSDFLKASEIIRTFLSYDPLTGVFVWVRRPNPMVSVGTVAGAINDKGYRQIKFKRRSYAAARLAWFMHYGEHPALLVDHINGSRDDNRIANLRQATVAQNGANQKNWGQWKKGVEYRPSRDAFVAKIVVGGKPIRLGYFKSEDDAHAAYCAAAVKHFGEFARFE